MKLAHWLLAILAALIFRFEANAQRDTLSMPEVEVSAAKETGCADSLLLNPVAPQPLSQALAFSPRIYMRSYGVSGGAGISVDGLSPAQTQVFLDGILLNSPFLGQADVGAFMLPAIRPLLSNSYAGGGAAQVSLLSDTPLDGLRSSARFGVGSQGRLFGQAMAGYRLAKSWVQLAASHYQAANRFWITDPDPSVGRRRNQNAGMEGRSALLRMRKEWNKHISSQLTGVLVQSSRNLQPPDFYSNSLEHLDEHVLGASHTFTYTRSVLALSNQSSLSAQNSRYRPANGGSWAAYRGYQFYTATKAALQITQRLSASVSHTLQHQRNQAATQQYSELNTIETSASGYYSAFVVKAGGVASIWRHRSSFIPLLDVSVGKRAWQAQFSTTPIYRMPTLNDLYWPGAGNPGLALERGMRSSGRITYQMPRFHAEVEAFRYQYLNSIRWVPSGNLFMPTQTGPYVSRGINAKASFATKKKDICVTFETQWLRSGLAAWQGWLGWPPIPNQFIYTPERVATVGLSYTRGPFLASVLTSFTSSRYETLDNSYSLKGYLLMTARVEYKSTISRTSLTFFLQGENLTNSRYYLISHYPQPGLAVLGGAGVDF